MFDRAKIATFDYDDLEMYDDSCLRLFCLSDRDVAIVAGLLRFSLWTSRWYGGEKRLRDDNREADLIDAITRSERLIARIVEE